MTANELKTKDTALIIKTDCSDRAGLRLSELGMTRGAVIRVRRILPFGGPLELLVRGYVLTLRRSEARKIEVRRI